MTTIADKLQRVKAGHRAPVSAAPGRARRVEAPDLLARVPKPFDADAAARRRALLG